MAQRIEAVAGGRPAAQADFFAGMALASPIVVSVLLYGALFGALAAQAGLSPLEVALMSALVFSGAAQFVAVDLWSNPVAIGTVTLATLLVGMRHTLMGAALAPVFSHLSPLRAYGALFFMVDEAWALSVRRSAEGRFSMAFYAGVCAPLYVSWLASTVTGALLGGLVADPTRYGLDVVFTAVFIVLILGLWRGRSDLLPWGVSAAAAVACHALVPGSWYIFVGGVAGIVTAVVTWRPDHEH
ncbi:MAG: AzlC family ABC transporter permease [Alphaproteobacteria bacterium]|nr:AzlC family ABC transporter permease [Alphaproteobacteria bacterium]